MRYFNTGDLVLVINSLYNPDIIGCAGIVVRGEDKCAGLDKHGNYISGIFVTIDLPDSINRHGTTLWYFKPQHLIRITPDGKNIPASLPEPIGIIPV